MKKLFLLGAGKHAESCIDVIESTKKFKIIGLIGKKSELGKKVCGYKVIYKDEDIKLLNKKNLNVLITLGQIKSAKKRKKFFIYLKENKIKMPVIISPNAYVSKFSKIEEGTIVMHGAVINSNANIGKNCIINSNALIEHGVKIGNHCHVSTSSTLNGGVTIQNEVFVGSGSVLKQEIRVKSNTILPMGTRQFKNV